MKATLSTADTVQRWTNSGRRHAKSKYAACDVAVNLQKGSLP
jgi:hypothetical protein